MKFLQVFVSLLLVGVVQKVDSVSYAVTAKAQYDELYADGMRAYNEEDYTTAVKKYEAAVEDWKAEKFFTVKCNRDCKEVYKKGEVEDLTGDIAMDYFVFINHMRNCTKQCMNKSLGARLPISRSVQQAFDDREPYNFLQYSYHKIGNTKMAARAAATYLRFFPDNEVVSGNLEYYKRNPELKDFDVDMSLQPVRHHELYEKGRIAYNAEKWQETVDFFEEALVEYRKAYEECKILCNTEVQGNHQYYKGGVYGYHIQLMLCTLDCPRKLSKMFLYYQPAYLSKHYDYLQFSYGKLERYDDALECAVTFQLFDPISEHMISNVDYYKNKTTLKNVKPRQDGQHVFNDIWSQVRLLRQAKSFLLELDEEYTGTENLLDKTYERFMAKWLFPDDSLEKAGELEEEVEEEIVPQMTKRDEEAYKKFPYPTKEHIESFIKTHERFKGVTLTMMEKQLNGSYRVVFDGLATAEQCKKLRELGMTIGHAGDGYNDNPSPHTVKEEFLGVNVNNATLAAVKGDVPVNDAELYLELSENVRILTEAYFRLTKPLYFSYTHLVCRKAHVEQENSGMHISHPLHSDNCVLKDNGEVLTCVKEHPAYTWRDYSGLLYLNDDFVGGQFIFANPNRTVQAIVKPQCGRMVAFSAGFENLHGVLGVKEGIRCALPIWFTLDKEYVDKSRDDAVVVLRNLQENKKEHKEL